MIFGLFKPKISIFDDDSVLNLRVWFSEAQLTSCDHSMFIKYFEYGRWDYACRSLFKQAIVRGKIFPAVISQSIRYTRPLKRFQKFTVHTRLRYWDEKYFYVEHAITANRKIHAYGLVRFVFKGKQGVVSPKDVIKLIGIVKIASEMPSWIPKWLDSEAEFYTARVEFWENR